MSGNTNLILICKLLEFIVMSLLFRTYMDSRSPGLSSRIVQYNREAENRPTHQPKYGRPGVFPIVHLFKKEQSASPKPKTVTLRFAPSGKFY